ncbi:MAG: DUF4160 domain-containing protein [Clostridia bacterium]|nr:DUF4160 domain-containing protein [Clostridia bacterium]MBR5009626.1 DUF4160 domain-containing protein [Clostridia bacterium]MBR5984874.1 DUF4160 domain-containing protein [Clostridia bacterium]MBR6499807.1 DUF4160 domain-containing protein [Clostridia bacterium]
MTPISLFYGIIIYMYTDKSRDLKVPHIHAVYKDEEIIVALTGEVLDGHMHASKSVLVQAWLTIHQDDLNANWHVMMDGNAVFRIEPLR